MDFPETIIGIGGAGKKLIYSLLDNEWILEEILKPRTTAINYRVYIIDTAVNEKDMDNKKIIDIIKKIDEIRNKFVTGVPNNMIIDYQLFTEHMLLSGEYTIMGEDIINAIKVHPGADCWWFDPNFLDKDVIEKLKNIENFNTLNFGQGVIRRRALGKAIFYRGISENKININVSPGRIAMIIGLGGGTGSGTFIDCAKMIKQNSVELTLFGVMPTSKEPDRERANGYASICELENIRLNKNLSSYFDNIVLLPMEPTGYRGPLDTTSINLIEEFHQSFIYTFLSYYNLASNATLFEHAHDYEYAPFIVAASCIIRYNVEANRDIVNNFDAALRKKIDVLSIESDTNSMLGDFLKSYSESNITKDDDDWLSNKINDLNALLKDNTDILSQMGYHGIQTFRDAIQNVENGLSDDCNVSDKILKIKKRISITNIPNQRNEVDIPIKDLVNKELSILESSTKLFSRVNTIEELYDEKRILKSMIMYKDVSDNDLIYIDDELRKLDSSYTETERKRNELHGKCKTYKDSSDNKIAEIRKIITSETRNDIDAINRIESRSDREEINIKLENLNNAISDYIDRINRCGGIAALDQMHINHIDNSLKEFSSAIHNIDKGFNPNIVLIAAEDVKNYKRFLMGSRMRLYFLDKLSNFFGRQTKRTKNKEIMEKETRRLSANINEGKIFSISDNKVEIIFKYSLDDKIREYKSRLFGNIISKINARIDKVDNSGIQLDKEQRDAIETSIKENNLDNVLENILKGIIKYNNTIDKYREDISQSNDELQKIEEKKIFLRNLHGLCETFSRKIYQHGTILQEHVEHMNAFKSLIGKRSSTSIYARNCYKFEIEPRNTSGIIGRDNIQMLLQNELVERQSLLREINGIVQMKLLTNTYNGLLRPYIQHFNHKWTVSCATLCISSMANIANTAITNINDANMIRTSFSIDSDRNMGHISLNIGNRWDVGCTLFLAGIFTDNISSVTNPTEGYYDAYCELERKMCELIYLHHAYLLEEGKFINRDVISIKDEQNTKVITSNDPKEIKKFFKELHKYQSLPRANVDDN